MSGNRLKPSFCSERLLYVFVLVSDVNVSVSVLVFIFLYQYLPFLYFVFQYYAHSSTDYFSQDGGAAIILCDGYPDHDAQEFCSHHKSCRDDAAFIRARYCFYSGCSSIQTGLEYAYPFSSVWFSDIHPAVLCALTASTR